MEKPNTFRLLGFPTALTCLTLLAAVGCDSEDAHDEVLDALMVTADGDPIGDLESDTLEIDMTQEGVQVVPIEEGMETSSTASSNVVASLQLPGGGEVYFIDLGTPEEPGVATIYSTNSDIVGSLMREHEGTPLELFLALAPSEEAPPDVLVAHHERLASLGLAEPSPRSLPVDDIAQPPAKALSYSGGISNCAYSTPALYFSAVKGLNDNHYGFELGSHDQFYSSLGYNVNVTLGWSTSGWLASCRKSKGANNTAQMNLRFDQYSGGSWSTFWDPQFVDSTWGWNFAYVDTVNRKFRMALTTVGDDTAYVAARF